MAIIFLSYRRTDSPQACRVYDWLSQRFGNDSVFMDVTAIPFAVNFPNFIKQAIVNSKILIALIGTQWLTKIHEANDPVRMEIQEAIANNIPVLPVLIGNTPMPDAEELPTSISMIASQNAIVVGVLHDFNTHMQLLLPKIESILGALAVQSITVSDADMLYSTCTGIMKYLSDKYYQDSWDLGYSPQWIVVNTIGLDSHQNLSVTLFLHRVVRLAELVELHFILSFWAHEANAEHFLVGWVMSQLERTPIIPDKFFLSKAKYDLKIRLSDEDARQIWKMITEAPLQLSLPYVATISPRRDN